MNAAPKIAVIGGGIIGLSCADAFIRQGCSVSVFEKGSRVGAGAAEYNSGMIHPSQAAPWTANVSAETIKTVFALALRSKDILDARLRTFKLTEPSRSKGAVQLFDSIFLGQQILKDYERLGIPAHRYGGDASFGRFGLFFPTDQMADARSYMTSLGQYLVDNGCDFQLNSRVRLTDDVVGRYDAVIVAGGAESVELCDLPIKSVQGHALVFDKPPIALPKIPIMHAHSHSALTVFRNEVRLSGTIDEESPLVLMEIWEEIAPDLLAELGEPKRIWSGQRPVSSLGRPIISRSKIENAYICAGHGHMGWTLCAGSAELLADIVLKGRDVPEFAY